MPHPGDVLVVGAGLAGAVLAIVCGCGTVAGAS
jgi:NADPH-dependent 2,4-dienoyl-CoA reductase/sulfur reductase-like enzyme